MITATNTITGKETTQLTEITTEKEPDEESVTEGIIDITTQVIILEDPEEESPPRHIELENDDDENDASHKMEDPEEEYPPGNNIEVENDDNGTSHKIGFYVFGILSSVLVVVALLFVTNYLVRSRSPPVIPIERVELPPLDSYEEPIYERLTFTNVVNTQEHVGYVHMERRNSGERVMDSQGI
eukprot:sb/3471489/